MPSAKKWSKFISRMGDMITLADNKDTLLERVSEDADIDALIAAKTNILAAATRLANAKSGNSAITGTNTSVQIAHGYGSTPTADQISITPTNAFMSAKGWHITSIGSANFVVNIPTAPGGTDEATFFWSVI